MIVRILGEGQWVVEPDALLSLNALDERVETAVARQDQGELTAVLGDLLNAIRTQGTPMADDILAESDLVLPNAEATVEEVHQLLDETSDYYGLLPDQADHIDRMRVDADPGQ